jgi:glycosyltransferase involved in cell wall biosynthesis
MINGKKVGIFIIAYQAVTTLISAIERIPKQLKEDVDEIYVFDDCSNDNTYYAGLGYKYLNKLDKLNIYRNERNLGYGGNQKKGYKYAIEKGFDIVVMLHGDVQYAPEEIPRLIQPLLHEEAEAVFGSRILGEPLKGGMPIWKYVGNRFLTFIENKILKMNLSEYHTGFRAYSCKALKEIPFESCSDNYTFDTDIIIQFKLKGFRIKEIPIPTHYGKESHQITFRKSVKYGFGILRTMLLYILHQKGLIKVPKFEIN